MSASTLLYGGQATSAFVANPASLDAAKNIFRVRANPSGPEPRLQYKEIKASETVRRWDPLQIEQVSNSDKLLRVLAPGATAGAVLAGDGLNPARYVSAINVTAPATVTKANVIPVWDIFSLQFLVRLYHSTAGSSEAQDVRTVFKPQIPVGATALNTDHYGFGWWVIGTNADNYFMIADMTNQDATNGSLALVEAANEFDVADDFGAYWAQWVGLA